MMREVWVLSNNVMRTVRLLLNAELKGLELGSAEANILVHLFTQGDFVRQEEIVEQLDLSKPAISRALDGLEEKGYISRERDFSDRRACLVALTPRAQAVASSVLKPYERLGEAANQGLSQEEAQDFLRVFRKVSENLSRLRECDGDSQGE